MIFHFHDLCFGRIFQLVCYFQLFGGFLFPNLCALKRGCVRNIFEFFFKIKFGRHAHRQPVCLWDVFSSCLGNVMHSAFAAFPSFPCECSAKVQLIQSLMDDSRQCPFVHRHTRAKRTHTHACLDEVCEVSAASASWYACEIIGSHTASRASWCAVMLLYIFPVSCCLSGNQPSSFTLSNGEMKSKLIAVI